MFHFRRLRISEFGNSFQRMGVLGVILRHISHASHVLLVVWCVYFTITSHDAGDTLLPWWDGRSMDYTWFGCLLRLGSPDT